MSETSSSDEEEEVVEAIEEEDDEEEEEDEEEEDDDDQSSQNELGAWRQVHEHLTKAVAIAQQAVASKKLQRRFWLEEVCANLTEEGKLTPTSVWKRPVPPKKTAAKKPPKPQKEPTAKKMRKKKAEPKPKRIKKKKTEAADDDVDDNNDGEEPKAKKIRLKLKKPAAAKRASSPPPAAAPVEDHDHESQETSDEEDDESGTETGMSMDYQHDTGAAMHPSDYPGHSWGSGQQQHNSYMAPPNTGYGGSPGSQQYAPYGSQLHDQYTNFYAGGMQAGLTSQGMYSTFSGPPAAGGSEESSSEEDNY